eukprot:1205202-Pyramimonas_sp.AAC.1
MNNNAKRAARARCLGVIERGRVEDVSEQLTFSFASHYKDKVDFALLAGDSLVRTLLASTPSAQD